MADIKLSNSWQEAYAQVLIANVLGGFVGTQETLQKWANKIMPTVIGQFFPDWEVQWGPCVWKNEPGKAVTGPDNVWFVTRNKKSAVWIDGKQQDTILVAMAGTAVFSWYDWNVEDRGVSEVIDYSSWIGAWKNFVITPPPTAGQGDPTSDKAWIAQGTSVGLYQILNGKPSMDSQRFIEWFQSLKDITPETRIIFAGHSLAGALSPAIALAMTTSGFLKDLKFSDENISILPAAGATPGDKNLSGIFKQTFPGFGSGYQNFNYDFYNKYDIVPMAWSTGDGEDKERNIDNITSSIYTDISSFWLKEGVNLAIKHEKANASKSGIVYQPIQGIAFEGDKPGKIETLYDLVSSIVLQHTVEYAKQIAASDVLRTAYNELKAAAIKDDDFNMKDTDTAKNDFPVTRSIKIPSGEPAAPPGVDDTPYDVIGRPNY